MKISKLLACAGALTMALAADALAGTVYYNGALTTNDPLFVNPGGSTTGGTGHYYDIWVVTVDTSGTYVIETSGVRTNTTAPSDALDTYLRVYTNLFNPAVPGTPAALASNDDFTGALTVLPGPYGPNGVTATGTGFQNAQPSSRISMTLNTGTTYFIIQTSFRRNAYVGTGVEGGPTGLYYTGISGPGNITVPAPSSLALVGLGGLIAGRRRRA